MEFKTLLIEKENLKELKRRNQITDFGEDLLTEITQALQLLQPDVSGSSLSVFLDYEIRSSWWASWIGWNWGQKLSGKYFAWKASRKYTRYKQLML